jgi:phytoene dehydrogenase-like protein
MAEFEHDVIVAGGGIGGLFAGATLARAGRRVLLLEKNAALGGYATSFRRQGFFFEAAIHALNGLERADSPFHRLFSALDLLHRLPPIRLPELYSIRLGDRLVALPADHRAAEAHLRSCYPADAAAITRFFAELIGLKEELDRFPRTRWKILASLPLLPFRYRRVLKHFRATLGSFMDALTDNEELKILLTANAGYYHDDPYDYSLLHFAAAQGSYLTGGASFLTGGSAALAEALGEEIRARGGTVRTGCEVTRIEAAGGRIGGVCWRGRGGETARASTAELVAGLPFPALLRLLPAPLAKRLGKPYRAHKASISVSSVYYGLARPLSELGSRGYSTFFFPAQSLRLDGVFAANNADDPAQRILCLVDYSAIPGIFGERERGPVAVAVVVDRAARWRDLSREEYAAQKARLCAGITAALERRIPGFTANCRHIEGATPLTMERFTGNPDGAIYGFAPTVGQLGPGRPQVATGIRGLTLASAWGPSGGGITAAARTGVLAAREVMRRTEPREPAPEKVPVPESFPEPVVP